MNVTDYTFLLNRPDAINDRQTQALEKIVSAFPYFQSARALRLKGLYNQNSFQYNNALKITAAHTTDRSVLFDFITSDTFTAIHKGLYEQKLAELNAIEVTGIEVIKSEALAEAPSSKLENSILTSIKESEIPYAEPVEEVFPAEVEPEDLSPVEVAPQEVQPIEITIAEASAEAEPDSSEMTTLVEPVPSEPVTAQEKLEIGKPLEFSRDERHSFTEWLQLSRLQPINRQEEAQAEPQQNTHVSNIPEINTEEIKAEQPAAKISKETLIDRFIMSSPKIPPVRTDVRPAPLAETVADNVALMTETLARVYLEQKKYQKAIQAYEILILKYPEKSSFFADRISEIKNLQQNN